MHIGRNIRFLRKTKGWTQDQLAQQLDKTYITIGDYERGKVLPPLTAIAELCQIFAVEIDTLVYRNIEKDGLPLPAEKNQGHHLLEDKVQTLQRLTHLQEQRLAELEREIREHAPDLAQRLGLDK